MFSSNLYVPFAGHQTRVALPIKTTKVNPSRTHRRLVLQYGCARKIVLLLILGLFTQRLAGSLRQKNWDLFRMSGNLTSSFSFRRLVRVVENIDGSGMNGYCASHGLCILDTWMVRFASLACVLVWILAKMGTSWINYSSHPLPVLPAILLYEDNLELFSLPTCHSAVVSRWYWTI